MDINYDTDRLIIINYPTGAGGKFLSLCLAIAENVLHQDYNLAKIKIRKNLNEKQSFAISSDVINKSRIGHHFELGCVQLAGFNIFNKGNQEELSNDLWRQCTNQKGYFFCMMNNFVSNAWQDYPNAKHIILKNYDWILKERNMKISEEIDIKTFENFIEFDMGTCKNKFSFLESVSEICDFLNIKINDTECLDSLRLDFLKTFKLGFEK